MIFFPSNIDFSLVLDYILVCRIIKNRLEIMLIARLVSKHRLEDDEISELFMSDFALKCSILISEQYKPFTNAYRFNLQIYNLFDRRWGFLPRLKYKKRVQISSETDREKYGLYVKLYDFLTKNNIISSELAKYDGNYELFKKDCHSMLGGGEFPFVKIMECENQGEWYYTYELAR